MATNRQRTQEEIVVEAFRLMIRDGDARLTTIEVPLQTGGTFTKKIYKVKPRRGITGDSEQRN